MTKVKIFILFFIFAGITYSQAVDYYFPDRNRAASLQKEKEMGGENVLLKQKMQIQSFDSVKWSEGFEDENFPPEGWAVYDSAPQTSQKWGRYIISPIYGKASASVRYESGSPAPANDDWLVTPRFNVKNGDVLCFWGKGASTVFNDSLEILYSDTLFAPPEGFKRIACYRLSLTDFYQIPLTFLSGKNVKIAFHYKETNQFRVYIDSVYLASSPSKDMAILHLNMNKETAAGDVTPKLIVENLGYVKGAYTVSLSIEPGGYFSQRSARGNEQFKPCEIAFDKWQAVPGEYTVKGIVRLEGDLYKNNDTVSKIINVSNVLFNNGEFVNYPFSGPDGSGGSVLEPPLNSFGYNNSISGGFKVADDFSIPADTNWYVQNITFYAYQNGSSNLSAPFISARYRIWNGEPEAPGSSVVWGDTVTNRFISQEWAEAFRYYQNSFNTIRPIYAVNAEAGFLLSPGVYWIEWQLSSSLSNDCWTPPVSVPGIAVTGNARQFNNSGWSAVKDSVPGVPGGYPQGLPFKIKGFIYNPEVRPNVDGFTASNGLGIIELKWTAYDETNIDGFIIERKLSDNEYKKIGFIKVSGSDSEARKYLFADKDKTPGERAYRLIKVYNSGKIKIAGETGILSNFPKEFELSQNYPNPFNPETNIGFALPVNSSVVIKIFNILGQKVKEYKYSSMKSGYNSVMINASDMNSGVYFYSLTARTEEGKTFSGVKKMILAK
jgi:hypothetical protein